jgi:hypothetical protein
MGGDSARTARSSGDRTIGGPKVFCRDGLLFGSGGEPRIAHMLRYVFDLPATGRGQDIEQYLVRDLGVRLHAFLKDQAQDLLPDLDDEHERWLLLVGVGGRLFRVCSHLSVSESATGYAAIGSGGALAMGSLASTEGQPPRRRVELALRAAERHNGFVAPPFTILELPDPG